MALPNFIDYVRIHARSGNGGAGSRHFRREAFVPKGGPDGGDGGRGGHVIFRGNRHKWTLLQFKYTQHIKAGHGDSGGGARSSGKDGEDYIVDVPLGTTVKDGESGELIAEIMHEGQEEIILPGGMGGRGNWHFRTSTNQTPEYAQPGIPGVEKWLQIELKVLADVGLIGFPNAGKSTLLSVLSAAKPKIGDYPFTTLTPQLGVVSYRDDRSFIMADIPGLIEGAAEGKGLGTRFLRHAERNSVLLFVIPADADDPEKEYEVLRKELKQFNPELFTKDHLICVSKVDLLGEDLLEEYKETLPKSWNPVFISSAIHQGLDELKDRLFALLQTNQETV